LAIGCQWTKRIVWPTRFVALFGPGVADDVKQHLQPEQGQELKE
jgi:hypothetical protein